MDKQTESLARQEFENAWVEDNSSTPEEAEVRRDALKRIWHTNENGEGAYFDSFVMWAWKWWQKSRDSLVAELPRPTCTYADHSYPAFSQKQVEKILVDCGIRIKGEGV